MRVIVQRVLQASVEVERNRISEIGRGLMVLLGVHSEDKREDADWLAGKLVNLRIFSDEHGLMNRSVQQIQGEILVVSQFTLTASYKKGNRPSFIEAAKPDLAMPMYEYFVQRLRELGSCPVHTGRFGADMNVALINEGPVTIYMDSRNRE